MAWKGRSPGTDYEYIPFDKRELKKIIWGFRMNTDERNKLQKTVVALYPHADIYEARYKDHEYRMEIHRLAL